MMKKIIFDTDLGGDCDDVMALDLLLAAHKAGECELIGVTYSADAYAGPKCIYAILEQHGCKDIPIGRAPVAKGTVTKSDTYASGVAKAFYSAEMPETSELPDAAPLLRRLIAQNDGVTLAVTGFLTNIDALFCSGADEISPLGGLELARERINEIAVMGCSFSHINCVNPTEGSVSPDGTITPFAEWNIYSDIPAARRVFDSSPVTMAVCPFETGYKMYTGEPMYRAGGGRTPDSLSFELHGSVHGRDSWDPATALYAVYGAQPWFYRSAAGKVSINEAGVSDFHAGEGSHFLLECALTRREIAEEIDKKVMRLFK